ncbi:MAG: hypothetical protein QM571_06965 [Micrococcaceae bacterium]
MTAFVAVTLAIVTLALVYFGMQKGWQNKLKSQKAATAPVENLDYKLGELKGTFDGVYVATVYTEKPLERIAQYNLGIKNRATLAVYENGLVFEKEPQDVFIPNTAITKVGTTMGMIGKFVAKGKVLTIGWNLGDIAVETGFTIEPGRKTDTAPIADIQRLIEETVDNTISVK